MKRIISYILMLLLCLFVVVFISCDDTDITTKPIVTYSITYELNGGTNSENNPAEYKTGDTVSLDFPTKEDYMFAGWYTDSAFTTLVIEINDMEENLTLYAKWVPYEDALKFIEITEGYCVEIAPQYEIETLTIPSTYNGLPITEIYWYWTGKWESIKNVFIPETVTYIQSSAFIVSPGEKTSFECFAVDPNNQNYKSVDGVLYSKDGRELIRYPLNKSDTEYVIPKGVVYINSNSFKSCENLESVTIPDTVTHIGSNAFSECTALKSITIPDNVKVLEFNVFENCTSLETIILSNNIEEIEYGTFNGCISLKSITIPKSVKIIGSFAFSRCTNLKTLVIPEGVTVINNQVVEGCTSLEKVIISNNVTIIKSLAFQGCSNLTIYCKAASKPDGWDDGWARNVKEVIWGYKGE